MSDASARTVSDEQSGAKLENLYKPVAIAAVNAVTLCKNAAQLKAKPTK